MRSAPAVRCLLCISVCAKALVIPHGGRRAVVRSTPSMRAPWLKFAAAPGALAPRALQRGRDPRTLGEAWRWCRSYRFPEDVCEYAGAAGAALDPSAAAVAVYGCAQMVFAYRAFRRARASDEPGREAALGRGFLLIFLWHGSHFLAHEFKKPWAWFGSHYFYIFGFFQLARALNSTRAGARRLGAYLVGDGLITAWGGDYVLRGAQINLTAPSWTDSPVDLRTGRSRVGRHVRRARDPRLPDGRREDGPVRAAVDSRAINCGSFALRRRRDPVLPPPRKARRRRLRVGAPGRGALRRRRVNHVLAGVGERRSGNRSRRARWGLVVYKKSVSYKVRRMGRRNVTPGEYI